MSDSDKGIVVLFDVIEPFHRFVGAGMMTDLEYSMNSNTVPIWAVTIVAVIGPMIIFAIFYIRRRNSYDLPRAILGLVVASVCYLQFFPAPSDEKGFWPHAHFRYITEREGESQTLRSTELGNTDSTANVSWHGQMGRQTSQALDALEVGRGDQ